MTETVESMHTRGRLPASRAVKKHRKAKTQQHLQTGCSEGRYIVGGRQTPWFWPLVTWLPQQPKQGNPQLQVAVEASLMHGPFVRLVWFESSRQHEEEEEEFVAREDRIGN